MALSGMAEKRKPALRQKSGSIEGIHADTRRREGQAWLMAVFRRDLLQRHDLE
jgi:hypothetical protein